MFVQFRSPSLWLSNLFSFFVMIQALLFAIGCSRTPADETRFLLPFLERSEWKGKAEIARYSGTIIRYGQFRPASLVLITVWEPFHPTELVKSDSGKGAVGALKQNQVLSYQTGVYPYRQMNSLFWRPESGTLLKATMSTQEWCGHTFKDLRREGGHFRLSYNSYWEGEAAGELRIAIPGGVTLLYDELPLALRSDTLRKDGSIHVFPLLMSSQVKRPDWDIFGESRTPDFEPGKLTTDHTTLLIKGKSHNVFMTGVEFERGKNRLRDTYFFDADSPNRTLLRWERHDGSVLTLDKVTFAAYWQMNKNGDTLD